MADGSLIFDTKIDEKGAKTGLDSLKGLIKVGIGAMAAKIGKDIIGIGMSFNSQIQQYQTNFEVMMGDAEKAAKHVEDLKKMGAKTPFELSDLAEASQQLQQFGVSTENVQDNLTMLGDISLGNKERFKSLALVFGQVKSQGKLMGQDMMQMINAGFNPLQVISEKTGESMASLKDKMSKGQITFEMLEDAMKGATSEGGKFYQGMEKQSKTFAGQMSTLKDNINEFLGALTKPAFNWLSDVVLPKLIKGMNWVNSHIEITKAILGGLATAIAVGFAFSKFQKIASGISLVGSAMKKFIVANPWLLVASAIGAVVAGLAIFAKSGGNIEEVANKITGFASKISSIIPVVVNKLVQVLPKILNTILSSIMSVLPQILQAGVQILVSLISGIVQAIPQIISAIIQVIMALITAIIQNIPLLIQAGIDIIKALIQGLINAIPAIVAMIPTVVNGFITGIVTNLPTIIQGGITLIGALIEGLIQAIPLIIEALPTILWAIVKGLWSLAGALLDLGVKLLKKLWDGIASWTSTLWSKVKSFASSIPSAILKGLGSLVDIGINWVKGLWNGISSVTDWIVGKVKGFGSSIWKGIKGFFGINSPSRLMKKAGRWIGEGLGIGIEDSTGGVLDAVYSQASAIKEAYDDISISPLSYDFSNALNFAPQGANHKGILNGEYSKDKEANINQTFNFYEPHKTPSEIARSIRKESIMLGLAGGY